MIRRIGLIVLSLLACSTSSLAQTPTIDCHPPLDTTTCRLVLQLSAEEVQIPLTVQVRSAAGPLSDQEVTFAPTDCCVSPSTAKTGATGVVTSIWKGTVTGGDPIRIVVRTNGAAGGAERTIILQPEVPATKIVALHDHPRTWFRKEQVPGGAVFHLEGVTTPEECATTYATLTARGGTIIPTEGRGEWDEEERKCLIRGSWQFPDLVGEQFVTAELLGVTRGAQGSRDEIVGYSRQAPRVLAGLGYASKGGGRDDGPAPFFAVDFPVFSPATCPWRACNNFRPMVGSLFDDPERNYFIGLLLLPATGYEREALPLQIGVAAMNHKRIFGTFGFDATAILGSALKGLGAPW